MQNTRIKVAATITVLSLLLAMLAGLSAVTYAQDSTAEPTSGPMGALLYVQDFELKLLYFPVDEKSEPITLIEDGLVGEADWSPDGSQIVYSYFTLESQWDLFVMNVDGTDRQRLTNTLEKEFEPRMSPDGTQIAYMVLDESQYLNLWDIHVMDINGSNARAVTDDMFFDGLGDWSPHSQSILFASNRFEDGTAFPTGQRLYLINLETEEISLLAETWRFDQRPMFSPDGRRIAFNSNRTYQSEVYVMNADGSDILRLTNSEIASSRPTWSPDGQYIAFLSSVVDETNSNAYDIFVISADGGTPTRITNDVLYIGSVAFSPVLPTCTVRSSQEVNLREGPGTTFDRSGTLAANITAEVIESQEGSDGAVWYQIGGNEWVRGDLVTESPACAAVLAVS
jgi:dipeptidyl aminopeptidase/acylaminoacyl peptidase